MRLLLLFAGAALACAAASGGQSYYEASGLTAVFTLAAGAKAGPVEVKVPATAAHPRRAISATICYGRLRISGGVRGVVKIYRLDGREAGAWQVGASGVVALNRPLPAGVCVARIEAPGMAPKTMRLAVANEGRAK